MGFVNEKDENGQWQTIDKERNIVLVKTRGPHPESGYEFELTYKEKKIRIRGDDKGGVHVENGEYTSKDDVIWEFYEMYMPTELRVEQDIIQEFTEEALKVYGVACRQERAHSVTVEFKL